MVSAPADGISMDEYRAAFHRAQLLKFHGFTFGKAMAVPVLRWALGKSALAHRQTHHIPAQPRLF